MFAFGPETDAKRGPWSCSLFSASLEGPPTMGPQYVQTIDWPISQVWRAALIEEPPGSHLAIFEIDRASDRNSVALSKKTQRASCGLHPRTKYLVVNR